MMKHFLCIKNCINYSPNNQFLNYVFYNGLTTATTYTINNGTQVINNAVNSFTMYEFYEGFIYHTQLGSNTNIIGSSGSFYDLTQIKDYFIEIDTTLEDDVKKIIEIKAKKGDRISITPYSSEIVANKRIINYEVLCYINERYHHYMYYGPSIIEGILSCYKQARKDYCKFIILKSVLLESNYIYPLK